MPELLILVGFPGVGKTTWARKLEEERERDGGTRTFRVSSDDLIAMSGPYCPERQSLIRDLEVRAVSRALDAGLDVVVDRTNLTRRDRVRWVQVAGTRLKKPKVVFVVFEGPGWRERNAARPEGLRVPDEVLDRMAASYEPPCLMEGADSARHVHDDEYVVCSTCGTANSLP